MARADKRKSTGGGSSRKRRADAGCSREADFDDMVDPEGDNSGSPLLDSSTPPLRAGERIEFENPMDLSTIPMKLRPCLTAAAPVLLGREAVYLDDFFREVAGLCDRGMSLKELEEAGTIADSEIEAVWRHGKYPQRYEISNCRNKEQAALFVEHNVKVFG